jgi:hypothetical protein
MSELLVAVVFLGFELLKPFLDILIVLIHVLRVFIEQVDVYFLWELERLVILL